MGTDRFGYSNEATARIARNLADGRKGYGDFIDENARAYAEEGYSKADAVSFIAEDIADRFADIYGEMWERADPMQRVFLMNPGELDVDYAQIASKRLWDYELGRRKPSMNRKKTVARRLRR